LSVRQRRRGCSGLDDLLEERVLDSSSVKAVDELLHVAIKVLLTHAMVCPAQPSLEIREDRMDPRQDLGGPLSRSLSLEAMAETSPFQTSVSLPGLGAHGGTRSVDDILNETTELFLVNVTDCGEPKRSSGASTIFDGRNHDGLLPSLAASTQPLLAGAEIRLVDFDISGEKAPGLFGQSGTHFVQDRPSSLVVPHSSVALELERRDPLLSQLFRLF
jgi:hypothetical protein